MNIVVRKDEEYGVYLIWLDGKKRVCRTKTQAKNHLGNKIINLFEDGKRLEGTVEVIGDFTVCKSKEEYND